MADKTWTQAEVDFASRLSKDTGADFYTIFGWEVAEGGPPDNPLNIGPGQHFGTPVKAADASADLLSHNAFYKDIMSAFQATYPSKDAAEAAQAKAIAYNTHWNVIDPRTHTPAEVSRLRKQYLSNISAGALQAIYEGVQPNSKIDAQGNIQNPPDPNPFGGGIFGGVEGAIGGLAHDIAAPFEWLGSHWDRILLVIAGGIIIIIALVLVANSTKSNVMSFKGGE